MHLVSANARMPVDRSALEMAVPARTHRASAAPRLWGARGNRDRFRGVRTSPQSRSEPAVSSSVPASPPARGVASRTLTTKPARSRGMCTSRIRPTAGLKYRVHTPAGQRMFMLICSGRRAGEHPTARQVSGNGKSDEESCVAQRSFRRDFLGGTAVRSAMRARLLPFSREVPTTTVSPTSIMKLVSMIP